MHEFKAKEIQRIFISKMKLICPFFIESKSRNIPKGSKVYIWKTKEISCFLLLKIFPQTRHFSLEVFWSKFNELPENLIAIMAPYDNLDNIIFDCTQNAFAGAIEHFWGAKHSYEWKLLEKKSEVCLYASKKTQGKGCYSCDLDELIDDSINKINTFVIPYFKKIQKRIRAIAVHVN